VNPVTFRGEAAPKSATGSAAGRCSNPLSRAMRLAEANPYATQWCTFPINDTSRLRGLLRRGIPTRAIATQRRRSRRCSRFQGPTYRFNRGGVMALLGSKHEHLRQHRVHAVKSLHFAPPDAPRGATVTSMLYAHTALQRRIGKGVGRGRSESPSPLFETCAGAINGALLVLRITGVLPMTYPRCTDVQRGWMARCSRSVRASESMG
jgi:hypothetical protein